jgi:hypothetical protein
MEIKHFLSAVRQLVDQSNQMLDFIRMLGFLRMLDFLRILDFLRMLDFLRVMIWLNSLGLKLGQFSAQMSLNLCRF